MERQEKDEASVLHYYQRLVALRKSPAYKEVFTYGTFSPAFEHTETVMAYYRTTTDKKVLVAANFGREAVELTLAHDISHVLLSNMGAEETDTSSHMLRLESCEVIVLECGQPL